MGGGGEGGGAGGIAGEDEKRKIDAQIEMLRKVLLPRLTLKWS